ncbi:hypothetical protein DL95DRAFT_299830 [Leptodontidium sp. 2 PMI_412]|nr:hypothetical protein DL95DRAFT_299830 [Leptodontidium sp. 2 PMI_412]
MPSKQEIASKLAYLSGQLNAGGRNKQMMEWWREYQKLKEEFEEAKAREATARDTAAEESLETTAKETWRQPPQRPRRQQRQILRPKRPRRQPP